jgi:hypothetical protein
MLEIWDLWMPSVGATGLSFARSRVDDQAAGNRLLVHAAPPELDVVVRDQDGNVIAQGTGLERGQPGPMSYLVRQDGTILLEDGWPTQDDLGRLVILPGGEAGILKSWWHADDHANGAGRSSSPTTPDKRGRHAPRPHHRPGSALPDVTVKVEQARQAL